MSLSATLFGRDSLIFKATNILGLGIPGWLDKTFGAGEAKGQSLGEIAQQTAKEAEPRVIVWGRVRPIGGNVIHAQEPVRKWVKQSSGGGKGGSGSKTQKVEHVFRTYAIGVCEGPITGYTRIWRNNKLVYDARGNEWGEKNNGVFLKSFRLYIGGWNQMPSPDLEAIWGVGNIPAYRGTAYMVSINEDLTELGGSVPQWLFEVERAEGFFLTSKPYPIESIDGFDAADGGVKGIPAAVLEDGFNSVAAGLFAGVHRTGFLTYENWPPESFNPLDAGILAGVHRTGFLAYDVWPPESFNSSDSGLVSGVHRVGLTEYLNWPAESFNATDAGLLSGVHNG